MDDAQWERLEAKRERNRYFMQLEVDAAQSQVAARKNPKNIEAERRKIEAAREKKRREERREAERSQRQHEQLEKLIRRTERAYAKVLMAEVKDHDRERKLASRLARQFQKAAKIHTAPGRPRITPERCIVCRVPLRSSKTKIADAPGTRAHWGKGKCQSCHQGKVPGGRQFGRGHEMIHDGSTSCDSCGHTLRPSGHKIAQHPNTRVAASKIGDRKWLCTTCQERRRNNRQAAVERPDRCVKCEIPMSPRGVKAGPGQRQHVCKGLCTSCKSREDRANRKTERLELAA